MVSDRLRKPSEGSLVVGVLDELYDDIFAGLDLKHLQHETDKVSRLHVPSIHASNMV